MLNGFAYCQMHFDDNAKPCDFTYLSVNRSFETLTGLKNVVGKKVSEIIPDIWRTDQKLLDIYGRVSMTGKPERFEFFLCSLQEWFLVSVYSPSKEHFVAVFDVITERKRGEKKLIEAYGKLEEESKRLQETNVALKILMQHRDVDKKELEANILSKVNKLVLPYLKKVKENFSDSTILTNLELVEMNLQEIVSPFAPREVYNFSNLSPAEFYIVDLIKLGKTTKEIAALLNLSPATIATHRRRIRRKTGLTNSKINLSTLLSSHPK